MDGTIILKGGGRLTLKEEGGQVRLEAERPDDRQGLYKVWLCGTGGRCLLGTLVPEGKRLYLCRRMSRSNLERAGCWPITGGECVMVFSFQQGKSSAQWQPAGDLSGLIKERDLLQAVQKGKLLYKGSKEGFCLAGRFDSNHPFPIPMLFCVAQVGELFGRPHVFFYFDREGMPVLPHKTERHGEE